jgi:AraC-like DNA-binding protein
MPLQQHAFNELIVPLSGKLHIVDEFGRKLQAVPGQFAVYPEGCGHAEQSDRGAPIEHIFLIFTGEMRDWTALTPEVGVYADTDGRVATMARWLFQERQRAELDFEMQDQPLIMSLFRCLMLECRRLMTEAVRDGLVEQVQGYLRTHYGEKVTLNQLAGLTNMSKYHLLRTYRNRAGETPMASLRRIRMLEARNLIVSTSLTLRAIASTTGFCDEYHLSKAFKVFYGESPTDLRSRLLSETRP